MAITDLIPWGRNNRPVAPRIGEETDPFLALSRNMNQILDDFTRGFGVSLPASLGRSVTWPHLDVSETENEVKVVVELPGMEQNEFDLSMHDGMLTIKGEKKSETNGMHHSERWHGRFQRSLQLGPDVDPDKVSASFRNGELTVVVAKRPDAQRQVKRIPITT